MSDKMMMKKNEYLNIVRKSVAQPVRENLDPEYDLEELGRNAQAIISSNETLTFQNNFRYLKELIEERMEGSNAYVKEIDIVTNGLETAEQVETKKPGIKERNARKAEYKSLKDRLTTIENRLQRDIDEIQDFSGVKIDEVQNIELELLRLEGYTEQSEVYITTKAKYDLIKYRHTPYLEEVNTAASNINKFYSENADLIKQAYTNSTKEDLLGNLEKLRDQVDKFSGEKLISHEELLGKTREELLIMWKRANSLINAANKEKDKTAADYKSEAKEKEKILNKSAEERKELTDEDEARLSVGKTRALNRAFLKDKKFGGDSSERREIKDYLAKIEALLDRDHFDESKDIEEILTVYQLTISKCITYTQKMRPDTDMGKRRLREVEKLSERLQEDVTKIKLAKRLLDEKKQGDFKVACGSDLLVLAELNMRTDNEELEQGGVNDASEAMSLTLEDFAQVVGKNNLGQVEFRDGKLHIINNRRIQQTGVYGLYDIFFGEDVKPTIANQQLRERLYQIALKSSKHGEDTRDMQELKEGLEVGAGKSKALPISRNTLAWAFSKISKMTLKTSLGNYPKQDDATTDREKAKRDRYSKVANGINQYTTLIGGADSSRDMNKRENQNNAFALIKDIITEGRKLGVNVDMPNSSQMYSLMYGGIFVVQSNVYTSAQKIMDYAFSMNNGESVDNRLLTLKAGTKQIGGRDVILQNAILRKLWAFNLKKLMLHGEIGEAAVDQEIEGYIRETAFKMLEASKISKAKKVEELESGEFFASQEFRQSVLTGQSNYEKFEQINIPKLTETDGESLESYITHVVAGNPKLETDLPKIRKGAAKLTELSKNLKELSALQDMAYKDGLNEEERNKMKALAADIQGMLSGEDAQMIQFTADKLKGSVYAQGFAEALKLAENDFLVNTVNEFTELTQNNEKVQEVKEEKTVASIEERLSRLDDNQVKIVRVLLLENVFSGVISGVEKEEQGAYAKDVIKLCRTLRKFPSGKIYSKEVTVGGVKLNIIQTKENILRVKVGKETITLNREVGRLANAIEDDIVLRGDLYGEDYGKNLINNLNLSAENMGEKSRARSLCIKYFASKTKKPETFFTNVSSELLEKYMRRVLEGSLGADSILAMVSVVDSAEQINGEETRELLDRFHKTAATERKASMAPGLKKEVPQDGWSEEERSVMNLIADMLYSEQTWTIDDKRDVKGQRLKDALVHNLPTLVNILGKPELLDTMIERIGIFDGVDIDVEMTEKEIQAFQAMFGEKSVKRPEEKKVEKKAEEKAEGKVEEKEEKKTEEEKEKTIPVSVNAKQYIKRSIVDFINDPAIQTIKNKWPILRGVAAAKVLDDKEKERALLKLEVSIDSAIEKLAKNTQSDIANAVDEIFKKAEKKDYTKIKDQSKVLDAMCEGAINGDGGQGEFARNVFKRYFANMSLIDQRSMLSSAFRHAKPKTTLSIPEGATGDDIEEIKKKGKKIDAANYLGGILKGAGPLLQKMVQGLPIPTDGTMPAEFVSAINDVKSKLSPIPERIVLARLHNIVERSEGKITKLEVVKAMGAGSVGQAFLCNVEGPGIEAGKQVVVKLLRPDVRNRMMREKDIMIQCARITDKTLDENGKEFKEKKPKGGMQSTYEAQLVRIEEELDLQLEAQFVQNASVYDHGFNTVHAMKLSDLAAPTTDTMVIEKAPGETVDAYLEELDKKQIDIMKDYVECEVNEKTGQVTLKQDDGKFIKKTINKDNVKHHRESIMQVKEMIDSLRKRQKYVVDLANMWVTEAIFGGGFAMLDPHMGNIMVDDNGLTLIDYGNSAIITEKQQKYVTRMVMAAAIGDVDIFRHGFHKLLENTPEEVYNEKKPALNELLRKVFSLGNGADAGKRIITVLAQAQAIGLELPAALASFSQAQIRLQNTIESMNSKIKALEECEKTLTTVPADESFMQVDPLAGMINKAEELTKKGYGSYSPHSRFKNGLMKAGESLGNSLLGTGDEMRSDMETLSSGKLEGKYCHKSSINALNKIREFEAAYRPMIGRSFEALKKPIPFYEYLLNDMSESLLKAITDETQKKAAEDEIKAIMELAKTDEKKNFDKVVSRVNGLAEYSTSIQEAKIVSTFVKKRDEINSGGLEGAELDAARAELTTLRENAYEYIRGTYRDTVMNLEQFQTVIEKLGDRWGDNADMDENIDDICADTSLSQEKRDNLRRAYENYKQVKASNALIAEFKKSIAEFMCAYLPITIDRAEDFQKITSDKANEEELENFGTVMSDIIQSYLKSSIKKLGRWNAFKSRKKVKS